MPAPAGSGPPPPTAAAGRVAGSRSPPARPAAAAHHDAPARIEDQESFLVREPLAKRVEISAQTAERFFVIPSLDSAQVLSDDVRAGRYPQRVEALVKP